MSALIDTGPLVAFFHPDDDRHDDARKALKRMKGPMITTWAVLAEAAHLLKSYPRGRLQLLDVVGGGDLRVDHLTPTDTKRARSLMSKYGDLPMDLADATLVCLAEREKIETIVTFDKDFRVYRPDGIGAFKLVP